jgi:diketogulonate reductase-like aldo/keto reductase
MITQRLLLLAAVAQAQKVQLKPSTVDESITVKGPVNSIPQVGFGTWMIPNNNAGAEAVAHAIKLGYRHLDGATAYTNQEAVGRGIAKALADNKSIKREDLWITTKLWTTVHKAVDAGTDMNLKQLGLDYLDLQLVHFPIGNTQRPKVDAQGQPVLGPDRKPVNETVPEFDYVEVRNLT